MCSSKLIPAAPVRRTEAGGQRLADFVIARQCADNASPGQQGANHTAFLGGHEGGHYLEESQDLLRPTGEVSESAQSFSVGDTNGMGMDIVTPKFLEITLTRVFECEDGDDIYNEDDMPKSSDTISVFFSVSKPEIQTSEYVKRVVKYAQCSDSAFVVLMVYLRRLAAANEKLKITPYNMHRLMITALMLAAKMLDDRCYSNAHYARVGGIAAVKEMNRLELEMLRLLDYRLKVTPEEYLVEVQGLRRYLPPPSPSPACMVIAKSVTRFPMVSDTEKSTLYCAPSVNKSVNGSMIENVNGFSHVIPRMGENVNVHGSLHYVLQQRSWFHSQIEKNLPCTSPQPVNACLAYACAGVQG